jgi:hypothetical protein
MSADLPFLSNKLLTWTAVVLVVVGVAKIVHAQETPAGPPTPPASAAHALPASAPSASHAASAPPAPTPLGFSVPVHIDVPQISVHANIMSVGLAVDHSLGVPPMNQARKAAWYKLGPAPGQVGSAVLDGHVDSVEVAGHRGAFYPLGQARPGQTIDVTRADHLIATFTIDSVEQAPKSHFPTDKVYASVAYPALRLITCGGPFNRKTHSYQDNTIVYAHLTSVRHV